MIDLTALIGIANNQIVNIVDATGQVINARVIYDINFIVKSIVFIMSLNFIYKVILQIMRIIGRVTNA
jgi:hypothetical protein